MPSLFSATETTCTSPAPLDIAHAVIQSCLDHARCITPLDVIRLSATCKCIAQLCQAKLAAAEAAAGQLLKTAADVTAAPSVHEAGCEQRWVRRGWAVPSQQLKLKLTQLRRQGVVSLQHQLQQAISTIGPLVTAVLISTPKVSMESAKALVEAGLEVTYPLLLGAARSNVQGSEVWILAQQRLGIPTALPPLAEYVCSCQICGGLELPSTSQLRGAVAAMTPEELADLLYLGLSVDHWHTCGAAPCRAALQRRGCSCSRHHSKHWDAHDEEDIQGKLWLAEGIFQLVCEEPCLKLLSQLSPVAVGRLLSRITANAAVLGPHKGDNSWIYTPHWVIQSVRCWRDGPGGRYPRFLGDTMLQQFCLLPAAANLQQRVLEVILDNAFQVSGLAMGCCPQPVAKGLPVDVMSVLYKHILGIRMMPVALYAMLWQAIACHQSDKALELCLAAAAAGITQQLAPWQVHELLTAANTVCPTVRSGGVRSRNTRKKWLCSIAEKFQMALTMTETAGIFKRVPCCTCSQSKACPLGLARQHIEGRQEDSEWLSGRSSPEVDYAEYSCYNYSHSHGAWGDFGVSEAPKKSRLLWQEHFHADTDACEILCRRYGQRYGRWYYTMRGRRYWEYWEAVLGVSVAY